MRVVVVAAVLAAAACSDATAPDLDLDAAVRVVHAAPETPRIEVVLEGESRTILEYAEVSEYFTAAAGEAQLQLLVGGAGDPLIELDTILDEGTAYTVLAAGQASSIVPIVLRDEGEPADSGQARIRFVHAAPTAGPVDIYVGEPAVELGDQPPVLAGLTFGDASDYMVLEARTYRVRVTVAGTQTILIDLPLLVLSSTRVHTIVMMDTEGSGPPHGLIALDDRTTVR